VPRSVIPTLVALDIETTGLDADSDSIIEIGAVKFKGDRVEGEYSCLINPGRPLPAFITTLTGITEAMLVGQPRVGSALAELSDFVGECDVVGHNIKFDLAFLRKKGALRYNEGLDTFDLAAVLLPGAGRYSLHSLCNELGIPQPSRHRALEDARVTFRLYRALVRRAAELPLDLLAEITRLGQEIESWGVGAAFDEAMQSRARERVNIQGQPHDTESLFGAAPKPLRPLRAREDVRPLDVPALSRLLEPGGRLARALPHFEHRPQQVEMLRRVARAFSDQKHLLVEAGTGTGKSLAYLIPAIQWAVQNGQRVVVSTNTINLQDQLIEKDLPDLQQALDVEFSAAVLKGRANYLCPRRFEALRRHGPKNADEMRLVAKLLVWLTTADADARRGDRASLTLTGPGEAHAWARLSAEDEGCTTDRCAEQMEGLCPFFRARRAADAAHVVIVNHALLLADAALENRILPEYSRLVIDEGHHLEAATTDGLSFQVTRADVERLLRDLGGPRSGALGGLLSACRAALPVEQLRLVEAQVDLTYQALSSSLEQTRYFFEVCAGYVREQRGGAAPAEFAQQVRLVGTSRSHPAWDAVAEAWQNLRAVLTTVRAPLVRLLAGLGELMQFEVPGLEAHASDLASIGRRLDEISTQAQALVAQPDPAMVYWLELSNDARLALRAAPLDVGPLVAKHIWNAKDAVVLTSATLTSDGKFAYLRRRLQAPDNEVDEVSVGSPFDYQQSTLLYIADDIPEPGERAGHQKAVEAALIALCRATRGRALVLFTSTGQLRQTAQAVRGPLERDGIFVYDQASGASRHQLLEHFRGNPQAVLLGTKSFWEGVDVPGQALSVLVIVKLPFDVPSEPIIAARSETFDSPFYEYNVPEAVLRFRQGFGRLIRTKTDKGVVAVFDRRLVTKAYGRVFLNSLPACKRRTGPARDLPALAAQWIDG
jgi:DNA polymerase-3 subunit epsilon/ATP-dependent DNA helicase DinG